MSIRDLKSNVQQSVIFSGTIATDTTTPSNAFDTVGFNGGVMFGLAVANYTDGNYKISKIQESSDNVTYTDIAADAYITDDNSYAAASADSAGVISTIGCFSTERYLKVLVESDTVTTGAEVVVIATAKGDSLPV